MRTQGLIIVLLVFGASDAYRSFQDEIPNGDHVPHPCKPNFIWWGVGHMNPLGGGIRNPFGQAFNRNGRTWTTELCREDSDGDGLTNGQELGDPNCVWTKGAPPAKTTEISHPGVCEPYGSDQCKDANRDITCDTGEYICDGINSPDVFNITLRFPPTQVPAKETSYVCFTFEMDMLEADVDYHLIGSQPYIDNPNVMHHMSIMGCGSSNEPMTTPQECNMAPTGCFLNLGIWTLGMPGDCVHKDAGFKISRDTITRLNIQHHWTNPQLRTDYVDSSGLILYLTRKLRKYNAAFLTIGDINLDIPAGEDRVVKTSTCSADCTRTLIKAPVSLMTGFNHMHYLGYQQNVEHFRNGVKLRDLTPDEVYSYDNPIVHEYKPLVELLPGDRLETTCVFRSTSRSKTTVFGQGSYDEMCFSFFTFFPAESMTEDSCTTWDDIEFCHEERPGKIYGCDYGIMFNASHPERNALFAKILDNCNAFGRCRKECKKAISEVKSHPCLSDKLDRYTKYLLTGYGATLESMKFFGGIMSCEDEKDDVTWPPFPSHAVRETSTLTVVAFFVNTVTMLIAHH